MSVFKANTNYNVDNHKVLTYRHVTRDNVELLMVQINKSKCFVKMDDVRKKGALRALSDKRRYCKTLTRSQYELLGSACYLLDKLKRQLMVH